MAADNEKPTRPRRRWYQFSLRTLLIVVTLSAVPLGWVGWEIQQRRSERAVIAWVEKMGGDVGFKHVEATSWWKEWGDKWFGESVRWVDLNNTQVSDSGSEEDAGEITLKLVSATEAVNRGENLYDVCDADSSTLEAIYATLFDTKGEAKDELDIEPGWNNLLFIEAVKIEPEYQATSLRVQLIKTAIAMFCPEGLIVAFEDSLDLAVEDWRQLGFKRIAESPFVFRDQLRVNPYEQ